MLVPTTDKYCASAGVIDITGRFFKDTPPLIEQSRTFLIPPVGSDLKCSSIQFKKSPSNIS